MCSKKKFFICNHCGNLLGLIRNQGTPIVCCGEKMTELVANTVEASKEKHLPEVALSGNSVTVQIGSVLHPMEEAHHIGFIYLDTERGGQRQCLKVGDEPKVTFSLVDDKPVAAFAYCNLHGLWRTDIG